MSSPSSWKPPGQAVVAATPSPNRTLTQAASRTVAFRNQDSWIWSLRAEKAKEPNLSGHVAVHPKPPQDRAAKKDTKELEDALDILEQEVHVGSGPADTSEVPVAPRPPRAARIQEGLSSGKKEMGDTMQFWSSWQSSKALGKRTPAWRSADSPERALLAKPGGRRVGLKPVKDPENEEGESPRKPVQPKTWAEHAKAEASANMAEGGDYPVSGAALDSQVVDFSRHRLQRMLQAGQRERVRQEMLSSLNLPQINVRKDYEAAFHHVTNITTPRRTTSPAKTKSKPRAVDKSTVEFALKRMGKQRGELQKVRKQLEQCIDGDKFTKAASNMDDVLRKSIRERRSVLVLRVDEDDEEE